MNAATEFDVGPLTWVKSEIDLALERADQALQQFATAEGGPGDPTQLKFGRTHLHQVHGALAIVGLDGVTQFADALEGLLEDIEQQKRSAGGEIIALCRRGLDAIRHYLDDLLASQPNQPLKLLPLYREILAARGQERVSATDLFFPDLALRPPRRAMPAPPLARGEVQKMLRQERVRFQRGLLAWLRTPHDSSGVAEMLTAVRHIEDTQDVAAARAFWWIAAGFLTALAEGTLPAEADIKQLCARIDLQIRRLLEGSKNVAERLMRDALYFVASADSSSEAVRQVKNTYQLEQVLPSAEVGAPSPQEAIRRRLRELIAATEEAWNKYCAGTTQALPTFREHANALSQTAGELGHTDFKRLTQAIAQAANWLAEQSTRHSESLAMEIATAILLTQNAQENYTHLGGDFAHQVDVMVARIHGCIAENPPLPGSEVPLLDEMSRQAQEKLLIGQVAREIQTNLAQIEQVLDGFFRDAEKRGDLAALDVPLRQVVGALAMMRQDAAVDALREAAAEIKRFSEADYTPHEGDFERVADRLSALGFFIDALQNGADDFDAFSRKLQQGVSEEAADEEAASSVEQELEQNRRETQALLEALRDQPSDAGLREELKQNLTSLQKDADLVADKELGLQAKAMLSALEAGTENEPHLDDAIATLKPRVAAALQPSAETIQLAQASSEEVDAELLEIFIEEAHEVLATLVEQLSLLREQPHNAEVLTTLRRAFHTLKGSGRMVGLKDLGEVAWSVEQVLNLWLRQELEVTPQLFDLIGEAHTVFAAWAEHLETRSASLPDPRHLVAMAQGMMPGGEELGDAALPGVAPAPATVPAEAVEPELTLPVAAETEPEPAAAAEIIELDLSFDLPEAAEIDVPASAAEPVDAGDFVGDFDFEIEPAAVDAARLESELLATEPASLPETPSAVAAEPAAEPEAPAPAAPPSGISPALFQIFLDEARSHLATLQREFGGMEIETGDPTSSAMARAAHTLAGIAGTVGLAPINRLGLALEHALLRRDGAAQPASLEAMEVVRQAIAALENMIAAVVDQRQPEAMSALENALDSLYDLAAPAPLPAEAPAEAEPAAGQAAEAPRPAMPAKSIEAPRLKDELDEQLLPIFLEEAQDLTQDITEQLRAWRANPADPEVNRALARLLHTLKGSARMAGAMNLGEITHAIETRVEAAHRSGNIPPELIDDVESTFDAIVQIVDRLQRGESLETPPPEAPTEPAAAEEFWRQHERRRSEPAVEAVAQPPAAGEAGAQRAMLRIRADLIDRLVNEAGELSIARARIEGEMRSLKDSLLDLTENVIRLRRQLREIEIAAESQMQSRIAQTDEAHAGFDPLEFDRFTRFQEITRMMAESVNDVATVQQNLLKNLDDANAAILAQARLNREVQQELMSVRMEPFASLAERLYRVVRQTAKELGKRANLEIKGGQVELDRSVLDKMTAPLEHLLRNAVAHGLEDRATRTAHGKAEIGEIALMLAQEGNEIILTFADDGAGLDYERIRARGIAAGLLGQDEEADTAKLVELIFTPGFSTASELSQVAGRGVGMDVVRTEVTALGGRIEVVSSTGSGTTFRLYIPLTLAVTQALLVGAGSRRFAIPSTMIEQVLELREESLARIRDAGRAEWMGNRYPFHFLPHLLGEAQALPEMHRRYWVLLLKSGQQRVAVQVDALKGNQEVVVKNIGPQLARVIGIDGATVLGDGQVVLILNPVALASRPATITAVAPIPSAPTLLPSTGSATTLPTVMVVDDSLTVRKITGRLLAREGYQVLTAKDGVEALEQMIDLVPDVLLVDIEMPRMDGFDLTRNVRADARLKDVPIIMITSRTADKHRNYALEIGANQYLGKPYQEEDLLKHIGEYIRQKQSA